MAEGKIKYKLNISDKLASLSLLPKEGKTYVPFCAYKYHVGISMFHEVCETRKCWHYRRLYVKLHD